MARVPLREGLLTTVDPDGDPRLVASRCPECARLHFPASADCPYCSCGACSSTPVGPNGRADVFTVVERPPPGYRGPVPYGFGVVAMPEGILVVTRLMPPLALAEGTPLRLVLEDLYVDEAGTTVVGFAFTPEGA